ncbi:amino acid permease [Candidatus Woesearchaeota archaeon]|nr:amino acid permease [Candidatus Woesearchaeota archaeon]
MKEHREHHRKRFLHSKKKLTLRRDLNLFQATACGVGIILGAGIYVLIGMAAGTAGNAVWLSFLLSALAAVFTGISYAELSSIFPSDAGEYVYAEHAFGRAIAFFVGYLAVLAQIITGAAVALGFAGYFSKLFGTNSILLIALLATFFFSFINFHGIKDSKWMNVIFTILETVGLFIIIFIALPYFGKVNYMEMAQGFSGVFHAAALVFFAYIGFESVVKLSEETKNPTKTIPRALLLSIAISTLLYILVAMAAVSVVGWETLGKSAAPLADVAAAILGSNAFVLLAVIALFSTGNTILMSLVAASRTLYGMSHEYKLLKPFTWVHVSRRTPYIAVFASMLLTFLFILPRKIDLVAEFSNFGIFLSFVIVNLALIVLRYKLPKVKRPFKAPLNIGRFAVLPFLGILAVLFLAINLQPKVILGGIAYSILGFVLYAVVRRFGEVKGKAKTL